MKHLAALGLLLLSFEASAQELNNCAGVITNRPCNGAVTPKPVTISDDALVRSKKSLILHDLTMKSIRAKREHEVEVDISKAREVCSDAATTVDACRDAVTTLDDRIEDRLHARALVESARKSDQPDPVATQPASNSTEVIIINNVRVYRTPRGGHPGYDSGHDHDHDHGGHGRPGIPRDRGDTWKPQEFVPPPAVPRPGRMRLPKNND